jgi:hypothetical protein
MGAARFAIFLLLQTSWRRKSPQVRSIEPSPNMK